jgi:hypothetical protein
MVSLQVVKQSIMVSELPLSLLSGILNIIEHR